MGYCSFTILKKLMCIVWLLGKINWKFYAIQNSEEVSTVIYMQEKIITVHITIGAFILIFIKNISICQCVKRAILIFKKSTPAPFLVSFPSYLGFYEMRKWQQ